MFATTDDVESPEMLRSNFLEVANYWDGRGQFRNAKAGQFRSSVIQALLDDLNLTWKRDDAVASDNRGHHHRGRSRGRVGSGHRGRNQVAFGFSVICGEIHQSVRFHRSSNAHEIAQ